MLIREFNIRYEKNIPDVVLYAGELLEHLGHIFLVDFGTANCIDKATAQYIAYLQYVHEREMRGY